MDGVNNIKNREEGTQLDHFKPKTNLNLNDLLKRRMEEKEVDKKNNLLIISCVTGVVAAVMLMLGV